MTPKGLARKQTRSNGISNTQADSMNLGSWVELEQLSFVILLLCLLLSFSLGISGIGAFASPFWFLCCLGRGFCAFRFLGCFCCLSGGEWLRRYVTKLHCSCRSLQTLSLLKAILEHPIGSCVDGFSGEQCSINLSAERSGLGLLSRQCLDGLFPFLVLACASLKDHAEAMVYLEARAKMGTSNNSPLQD